MIYFEIYIGIGILWALVQFYLYYSEVEENDHIDLFFQLFSKLILCSLWPFFVIGLVFGPERIKTDLHDFIVILFLILFSGGLANMGISLVNHMEEESHLLE